MLLKEKFVAFGNGQDKNKYINFWLNQSIRFR